MLKKNYSKKQWKKSLLKKLVSFNKKSPVLFEVSLGFKGAVECVEITHNEAKKPYLFELDYYTDVKDFIAKIKKVLVANHYPRLVKVIKDVQEIPENELLEYLERHPTETLETAPTHKSFIKGYQVYRIDKVILWNNIFILERERNFNEKMEEIEFESSTEIYKMEGSAPIFLKKYRQKEFESLEQASESFFERSTLTDYIGKSKGQEILSEINTGIEHEPLDEDKKAILEEFLKQN